MANKKLSIPDPNAVEEIDGSFVAIIVAIALSVLAIYQFSTQGEPAEKKRTETVETTVKDPKVKTLLDERGTTKDLAKLSTGELKKREWTLAEKKAVFQFGPASVAEALCEMELDRIAGDKFPAELSLELEKTLDRRAEFAPWACLVRAKFDGVLTKGDIHKEIAEAIDNWTQFKGDDQSPMATLDRFRETRNRPKSEEFYNWLKKCALNFDYQPSVACQRLLKQISPAHGADLLEVIDAEIKNDRLDRNAILAAGFLARNGQPVNWKVVESGELPDYDLDLRIGAVLSLCRVLDDGPLGHLTADQIAKTGGVVGRTNAETTRNRWWLTCSMLFGGDEEGEKISQFLSKTTSEDSDIRRDISFLTEHNICTNPEKEPIWFCASKAWTPNDTDVELGIRETFAKTSWLEFIDDDGRDVFQR